MCAQKKSRGDDTSRIWEGIVQYANSDLSVPEDFKSAKNLVFRCMNRSDLSGIGEDDLSIVDEVRRHAHSERVTPDDAFRFLLKQYQTEFRSLLTWLCLPDKHPDLGSAAARFLHDGYAGISWDIWEANTDFDETGNKGFPLYFWPSLNHCRSIVSPICSFIVDQIREFHEEDASRIEAIPIRCCDRAGCNRFKLPERQRGKCFCSDVCRARSYQQKKSPESKRRYMREYRQTLKDMSAPRSRSKRQRPGSKSRRGR
jgi:hypothetical protein